MKHLESALNSHRITSRTWKVISSRPAEQIAQYRLYTKVFCYNNKIERQNNHIMIFHNKILVRQDDVDQLIRATHLSMQMYTVCVRSRMIRAESNDELAKFVNIMQIFTFMIRYMYYRINNIITTQYLAKRLVQLRCRKS